jgi:hypothetical protein
MFGHIADDHVQADKRDVESEWADNRLRAKVVRLLGAGGSRDEPG